MIMNKKEKENWKGRKKEDIFAFYANDLSFSKICLKSIFMPEFKNNSKNIWYETKGLSLWGMVGIKRKAYFKSDLTNSLSSYIYILYLINLFC